MSNFNPTPLIAFPGGSPGTDYLGHSTTSDPSQNYQNFLKSISGWKKSTGTGGQTVYTNPNGPAQYFEDPSGKWSYASNLKFNLNPSNILNPQYLTDANGKQLTPDQWVAYSDKIASTPTSFDPYAPPNVSVPLSGLPQYTPTSGIYQPASPSGTGTVAPGQGGSLAGDTINFQAPPGTVGRQAPPGTTRAPQFTQNQGTSPFQNTQYNPLTPYNFMSIGGQGSMNQNPFLNNDPAGGTMMNQSQGFYKSLPNYGFYQR